MLAGQEYALLEEGAIVASLGVGNDLSRVSSKAQALADQLIETELLWSGDLDGDQANHVGVKVNLRIHLPDDHINRRSGRSTS